jgi:hypothetical protein
MGETNMPLDARPALFALALTLPACGGLLAQAESEFDQGQYPQAKQTLVRLEGAARGWGDEQRAAYALYRGLTYGALGDRARASVWLGAARAIAQRRPEALGPDDAHRLDVAIVTYELP